MLGFSAETEVNRKDWGLEWNMALEAGGVVVGDKIKLVIDAEVDPAVTRSNSQSGWRAAARRVQHRSEWSTSTTAWRG